MDRYTRVEITLGSAEVMSLGQNSRDTVNKESLMEGSCATLAPIDEILGMNELVEVMSWLETSDLKQTRLVSSRLYQASNVALRKLKTTCLEGVVANGLFPMIESLEVCYDETKRRQCGEEMRKEHERCGEKHGGCGEKHTASRLHPHRQLMKRQDVAADHNGGDNETGIEFHSAAADGENNHQNADENVVWKGHQGGAAVWAGEVLQGQLAMSLNGLKQFHWLKHLKLGACNLDISSCDAIFRLSRLESLELHGSHESRIDVSKLLHLVSLKKLELHGEYDPMKLEEGLAGLRNLKDVIISGMKSLSDGVLAVLGSLKALESVDVSSCDGFTAVGLQNLRGCRAIKTLILSACWNVTDAMCNEIVESLPQLSCLSLFEAGEGMTVAGLASLGKLTDLTALDFGYVCGYFDSNDVIDMLKHMRKLRVLNLGGTDGVTDKVLQHVCNNLKTLTRLDISECQTITQQGAKYLKHLVELEELNIGWNVRLSDEAVQQLPDSLAHLDLSYCSFISGRIFDDISAVRNLKYINLRRCTSFEDESLAELCRNCTQLERLDVSYTTITCKGLESLNLLTNLQDLVMCGCPLASTVTGLASLQKMRKLESLDLSMTPKLDDACLHSISFIAHSSLTTLVIRRCCRISEFGIQELKRLTFLRHLDVTGCKRVSTSSIHNLRSVLSFVHVEHNGTDVRMYDDHGVYHRCC